MELKTQILSGWSTLLCTLIILTNSSVQGDYLGNGSGEKLPDLCNRKAVFYKIELNILLIGRIFIKWTWPWFWKSNLIKVDDRLMSLRAGSRGYSYYDDGTGAGGVYVNEDRPYRWETALNHGESISSMLHLREDLPPPPPKKCFLSGIARITPSPISGNLYHFFWTSKTTFSAYYRTK